jgi:hypothetical protein
MYFKYVLLQYYAAAGANCLTVCGIFTGLLFTSAASSPWIVLAHAVRNNISSCNPTARTYKFSLYPCWVIFLTIKIPLGSEDSTDHWFREQGIYCVASMYGTATGKIMSNLLFSTNLNAVLYIKYNVRQSRSLKLKYNCIYFPSATKCE